MKSNTKYKIFEEDDIQKSQILGNFLEIPSSDSRIIDAWFSQFLEKHYQAKSFEEGQTCEKELDKLYFQNVEKLAEKSYKYILPKLVKYFNIVNSGYLKSTFVARLRVLLENLLIDLEKRKVHFTSTEFILITNYLSDNFEISPNGNLIENILKLEAKNKICSRADNAEKFVIISNILRINSDKGFHHDIISFKKILKLINIEDTKLIDYLKNNKVKNGQGCYEYIHILFNTPLNGDSSMDFDVKRDLISWLDSSIGTTPKQTWSNKMNSMKNAIGFDKLLLICDRIVEKEALRNYYFNENSYWSDDVSKRFIKSAKWMREYYKQ